MKKKTIIILHGWGGNPKSWQTVAEELKKENFQVETPSLPGFGKNKPLQKPYTIEDYYRWLGQFTKNKKIDKPIIVAHSNGGRIAGYFASRKPKRVEKIVLIAAAGIPPKNEIKKTIFKIAAQLGKSFFKTVGSKKFFNLGQKILYKLAGESDYLKASPVMKKTMVNLISLDLTEVFAKIKCPALIIWGKNDRITPLWMGKKIHQLINNSRLVIVNDGRHGLHLTHPKKISRLIIKFIKEKTKGSNRKQP